MCQVQDSILGQGTWTGYGEEGINMGNATLKYCPTCKIKKTLSDFQNDCSSPDGLQHRCRSCQSLQKARGAPQASVYWHRYHETRKMLVLSHYGVAGVCRCVICGESRIACLSLDHLSGEGHSDRQRLAEEHNSDKSRGCSAHQMYSYVINNNFPDGYQTLCMNCQFVKRAENKEYYHA